MELDVVWRKGRDEVVRVVVPVAHVDLDALGAFYGIDKVFGQELFARVKVVARALRLTPHRTSVYQNTGVCSANKRRERTDDVYEDVEVWRFVG